MEFILGLIAGAIVGVITERVFGRPFDRLVMAPLSDRFRQRQARNATRGFRERGELIELANGGVFIAQYSSAGISWGHLHSGTKSPKWPLEQLYERSKVSQLGPSWASVCASIKSKDRCIDKDPRMWNGNSLALVAAYVSRTATVEDARLELEFEVRDYATCQAIQEVWLAINSDARRQLLSADHIREVDPFLANGFGLNLTVETSDGKVLLTRRGAHTASWANHMHISMNEGLNQSDISPGGRVNIRSAFERGLQEELGIQLPSLLDYSLGVHSLVLDVDRYEWALLGHLDLRRSGVSSAVLRQTRIAGEASDSWEASEVLFKDFTLAAISSEFQRQDDWIPHGLVNLALSFAYRFPSRTRELREILVRE